MDRREALRSYFVEVVRDLGQRGVIRLSRGEPIEAVIAREGVTLLKELHTDLREVLGSIGNELLGGAAQIMTGFVQRGLSSILGVAKK